MAERMSTRLRNFIVGQGSIKRALTGGKLKIYTGTQPSSADDAPTGTLLVTITQGGGAITEEVLSRGNVSLDSGAAGSVDSITVNSVELLESAVSFNSSLSQTASDVVDAINSYETYPDYRAILSGANIIIEAQPSTGTGPNGYVVSSTCTTIGSTDTNMGTTRAGVNGANGLKFAQPSSGAIAPSGTWSGTAVATGTAGWARFEGSEADDDSDDSSNNYFIRLDGAVATSGSEVNLVSTSVSSGGTVEITSGTITQPAS